MNSRWLSITEAENGFVVEVNPTGVQTIRELLEQGVRLVSAGYDSMKQFEDMPPDMKTESDDVVDEEGVGPQPGSLRGYLEGVVSGFMGQAGPALESMETNKKRVYVAANAEELQELVTSLIQERYGV